MQNIRAFKILSEAKGGCIKNEQKIVDRDKYKEPKVDGFKILSVSPLYTKL